MSGTTSPPASAAPPVTEGWPPAGDRASGGALIGVIGGVVWILLLFLRWVQRPDVSLPSLAQCLGALLISAIVGSLCGLLQPIARTPLRSIGCGAVTGALLNALAQLFSAMRAEQPAYLTHWATFLLVLPVFVTCGALVWVLFLYVDPDLEPTVTATTARMQTGEAPRRLTGGGVHRMRWAMLVLITAGLYGCTTSMAPYAAGLVLLAVVLLQLSSPPMTSEVELWVSPDLLLVQSWRGTTRVPIQYLTEVVALPITGVKPTSISKEVVTLGAMLRLELAREGGVQRQSVYAVVPEAPDMAPMAHAEAWAGLLMRWRADALARAGSEGQRTTSPSLP